MKYQIKGFLKFVELDNYKDGCDPDSSSSSFVSLSFEAETVEALIKQAAEFFNVTKDGIDRNACDEPGRVDFCLTETEDTSVPSRQEIKDWKNGKTDLYYCVYSGIVEKVETVEI